MSMKRFQKLNFAMNAASLAAAIGLFASQASWAVDQALHNDLVGLPQVLQPQKDNELAFEDDAVVVQDHEALTDRFSPMVQEWEHNITFNPHFVAVAPVLLDLVDLSYFRSKSHRNDGEVYKSWNIKTFSAKRGFIFRDPKAGFVAFTKSDAALLPPSLQNQSGPLMVIVFHGSINNADWFSNYEVYKTNLIEPEYKSLNIVGFAHSGFVRKYLSASEEIIRLVDDQLRRLSIEELRQLKIYVTGHSQGAALSQIAITHLAQHLRAKHPGLFENGKTNVEVNRLNGWFLAAPAVFDKEIAKGFVENIVVGKANMIRQNVGGDLVPNLAKPVAGYKGLGFLLYQDGLIALKNAAVVNFNGFVQNVQDGELTHAFSQMSWGFLKLLGSAPHYVAAGEYRGHGFTPALVEANEGQLKNNAYLGQSSQTKGWFKRLFGLL